MDYGLAKAPDNVSSEMARHLKDCLREISLLRIYNVWRYEKIGNGVSMSTAMVFSEYMV